MSRRVKAKFLPVIESGSALVVELDSELAEAEANETSISTGNSTREHTKSTKSNGMKFSSLFKYPTLPVDGWGLAPPKRFSLSESESEMPLIPKDTLLNIPPPPMAPLSWIWTCHLCHSRYPLGVTRRCLVDGHYYCSGQSSSSANRKLKKRKRGQSCSSEFDYTGWKEWGTWKRKIQSLQKQHSTDATNGHHHGDNSHSAQGCENCEYPSECRYHSAADRANSVSTVTNESSKGQKGEDKEGDVIMTGTPESEALEKVSSCSTEMAIDGASSADTATKTTGSSKKDTKAVIRRNSSSSNVRSAILLEDGAESSTISASEEQASAPHLAIPTANPQGSAPSQDLQLDSASIDRNKSATRLAKFTEVFEHNTADPAVVATEETAREAERLSAIAKASSDAAIASLGTASPISPTSPTRRFYSMINSGKVVEERRQSVNGNGDLSGNAKRRKSKDVASGDLGERQDPILSASELHLSSGLGRRSSKSC